MKKSITILSMLPLLAFAQVTIKPITQVNDINKVGQEFYSKPVSWFQGESLRFDVYARDVRTPINFTGQTFPVLFVADATNASLVYIASTGTVMNATNGHVRVEVPYEQALLPTNTKYAAWMIAFRVTAGTTQEIATVAYSAVNVYPSPLGVVYTNIAPQTSYVINASGILTEFDPIYTGSVAAAITSTLTSQWSTAYSWGNWATNALPEKWSSKPATQTVNFAGQIIDDPALIRLRANGTTSTNPAALFWNSGYGTLNLIMDKVNPDGSPVMQEIGYNAMVRVKNASGATISNTWAVSIVPGSGGLLTVERARQPDKTRVIGLASHHIPDGEEGIVNWFGEVGTAATFGIPEGTPIYLSTNAAGINWTTNEAAAGASPMRLGYVQTEANGPTTGNGRLIADIFDIEADPLFASWLATNTYVQIESDPIWSASSNNIQSRIAATETGKVALTTYNTDTQAIWTAIGGIVSADNALTNVTGDTRISATKTGNDVALSFDATGLATGTPIYSLDGYVTGDVIRAESDPVWLAASASYYTISQADALFATGSPLYEVDFSPYATGTPIYTEADPVWTAAATSYYTRTEADALFITSAPVTVETDPVFGAWLTANGAAPEQTYAQRSIVATNPVIATNILIFDGMTNYVIELPTNGIAYVVIESDVGANQVNLVYDEGFSGIPPGTSTVYIGSTTSTNLIISESDGIPGIIASDVTNTISRISVYQYINPPSFGQTNDHRLMTVLVRDAELSSEPITKGTFDAVVGAIRVDQWSQTPAVTALDVNGNEIRFGNNFEAIATSDAFTFSYSGSPFMRFLAGASSEIGTGSTYIASAKITPTNVTLGVYASPGYIPRPQYGTTLTNWFDILSYVSSYPTNNYGIYQISFDTPVTNQTLFFRPVITNDPSYNSESTMEITADNLLLLGRRMIINDTNGNAVVTLSATGGLKVGTASFTADAAGNIAQDSTNTAALGQLTIAKVVGDLPLDAINAEPGYSRSILFPDTGTSSTNRLSSYSSGLFFYNPSNTNRLLGWRTRIVTEGSLADGINEGGFRVGTNSFALDKDGNLADDWNLGGYTLSNGIIAGYATTGDLALALAPYATTGALSTVETSLTAAVGLKLNASETNSLVYTGTFYTVLTGYVTTGALTTALGGYATTGALDAAVEILSTGKLDVATAIDTYATTNALGDAVSNLTSAIDSKLDSSATNDFVTSDTLTSSLAGYVETNALASELSSYATTAALSGYVATNGSAAGLVSFPASLLTVSGANSNYFRITTAPASSSSFGQRGQMAVSSSNLYLYNPDALGTGTGRWIRISGDVSW